MLHTPVSLNMASFFTHQCPLLESPSRTIVLIRQMAGPWPLAPWEALSGLRVVQSCTYNQSPWEEAAPPWFLLSTEALLNIGHFPSLLLQLQEKLSSSVQLLDSTAEMPGTIITQLTFIKVLSFQSAQVSYPLVDQIHLTLKTFL